MSGALTLPLYWYWRTYHETEISQPGSDDRLRDLELEIHSNTSGKEWERRGMSIR